MFYEKMIVSVISPVLVMCLMMPTVYAAADTQTSYASVIAYVADAQAEDDTDSKIKFGRAINDIGNFFLNDLLGRRKDRRIL